MCNRRKFKLPTYEYECRDCRHHFEIAQNMSDTTLTECPKCHGRLERLIGGGVGIIVKGGKGDSCGIQNCGGGECGIDPSDGPCCGGVGPGSTPPCMG